MADQSAGPVNIPFLNPKELNFSSIASNALHYWERKRLVYNGVLTLISVLIIASELPKSLAALSLDMMQNFFLLAVIANVLYCSAYMVDIFVQFSRYRESWLRMRWILLVVGTGFASVITRNIVIGSLGLRH